MPLVMFMQDQKSVEVALEENLGDVAIRVDALIPFSCKEGTCGTCIIEVKKGMQNLSPIEEPERTTLAMYGGDETRNRLACQCRVLGDVDVDLP